MPAFKVEVPHNLTQDEVTQRLKTFVQQSMQQYQQHLKSADGDWNGNVLSFSVTAAGMSVNGTMTVEEKEVHVDGQLPMLALPFRSAIQNAIASELKKALA